MLPWQPFLAFYIWGAHWHHLKNTTEPSMCGGDAALCQITLTTCLHFWCRLTQVVLEKRPLNGCSCSSRRSTVLELVYPVVDVVVGTYCGFSVIMFHCAASTFFLCLIDAVPVP